MLGVALVVLALVVVVPALVWVAAAACSVAASHLLTGHAEATHAGSDLVDTNV